MWHACSMSTPTPVRYVNQMYKPIVFGRHRVLGDHVVTYSYTGVGNILTQALRSCLQMLALLFVNPPIPTHMAGGSAHK